MSDGCHSSLQIAHSLLEEMLGRGNHVAGMYKDELTLLQKFLSKLETDSTHPASVPDPAAADIEDSMNLTPSDWDANEW